MTWQLNETRYYFFNGGSENDSKYEEELTPGIYEIEVHGANGGTGIVDGFFPIGGVGGYIKASFTVNNSSNFDIWVGQKGRSHNQSTINWGKHFGGAGGDSRAGDGGGSTEVLFNNGSILAVADAGGGSSGSTGFYSSTHYGGGGGARGGLGGSSNDNGEPGEGTGFGGAGGDTLQDGGDGGQEAGTGVTVIEETTGGRQNPPSEANAPSSYNSNEHGWVKITLIEEFPNIDWNNGNLQKVEIGTDNVSFTFTAPRGPSRLDLKIKNDNLSPINLTFPSNVIWPAGEPNWSEMNQGEICILTFRYDSDDKYVAVATPFFDIS